MRRISVYLPTFLFLYMIVLWFLLRLVLVALTGIDELSLLTMGPALLRGLWFDVHVLLVLLAPYFLLRVIFPNSFFHGRAADNLRHILLFAWIFCGFVSAASEIIFWQEFSSRANFIAVDYLVYTQEVIGNIKESYPMGWIFFALVAFTTLTFYTINRRYDFFGFNVTSRLRLYFVLALFGVLPLSFLAHNLNQFEFSNSYMTEISNNGLYSLFAAYRRNELQYSRFYKTIPQAEADSVLSAVGVARHPASKFTGEFKAIPDIHEPGEMGPFTRSPKNVILITVESLSAEYLGIYGNKKNLTPNLDRFAAGGYWFSHLFATGTRTVRGLEALSLGIPPVPGQAVVRRPGSDHLVTLGEMARKQNVETFFFYGGYGYFDNMNDYFLSNDYEVVDREDFDQNSITFANVWGVADEILFSNAARILTEKTRGKDRFFAQIMTTTNHRPFTYPDGRIDIPSPGGHAGGIKYTDYAIGKFIADAEKEPWFKDTVFIIVADHCASVAGKTKLPVAHYRIPLIIYAPGIVSPGVSDRTVSQIDIAPTILDVMGLHGDDYFFGDSLFENADKAGRAFVSNYQELGYYKNGILTVLKPKSVVEAYRVDPVTFESTRTDGNADLEREAISFYQTADLTLRDGELKFHDVDVE